LCFLPSTHYPLYDLDLRATHARTLLPAALASVSFGFVLVRVRVTVPWTGLQSGPGDEDGRPFRRRLGVSINGLARVGRTEHGTSGVSINGFIYTHK